MEAAFKAPTLEEGNFCAKFNIVKPWVVVERRHQMERLWDF